MVTLQQVKNGIVRYIDTDMLPHLTGIKKIGLGVYSALAAENAVGLVMKSRTHPAIAVLDIMTEDGQVDIDKLYQVVVPMFADGQKQEIDIPMIGTYRIDRSDIEKIYRDITGA